MARSDRRKEADKALDNILKNSENKIGKRYARAMKEIRAEIALMYARLKSGEEPSLSVMTRYNNLNNRMKSISKELTSLFRDTKQETFTMMEASYLESYFREAYEVEFQAQERLNFGRVDPQVIENAIKDPISGRSLDSRFIKNRRRLLESIEEGMTQGLILGESYRQIAKRISGVVDGDMKRALTTARTEAHRIQSMARLDTYDFAEEAGVQLTKVWDAALDGRTREAHQELDGNYADDKGLFHYGGFSAPAPGLFGEAKLDINCRCSVRAEVEGYEVNGRRARNPSGYTEIVDDMDYAEWYETLF